MYPCTLFTLSEVHTDSRKINKQIHQNCESASNTNDQHEEILRSLTQKHQCTRRAYIHICLQTHCERLLNIQKKRPPDASLDPTNLPFGTPGASATKGEASPCCAHAEHSTPCRWMPRAEPSRRHPAAISESSLALLLRGCAEGSSRGRRRESLTMKTQLTL